MKLLDYAVEVIERIFESLITEGTDINRIHFSAVPGRVEGQLFLFLQ